MGNAEKKVTPGVKPPEPKIEKQVLGVRRKVRRHGGGVGCGFPVDFLKSLGWTHGDDLWVTMRGKKGIYIEKFKGGE